MELLMASFSADKWSNIKCAVLLGNDNCAVFSFNCWFMIAFDVHGQSCSGPAHCGTIVTAKTEPRIMLGLKMMFDVLTFLIHLLTH